MTTEPTIRYDAESDALHVSFRPGERATGIELNDHILLRINKRDRVAVGLTFFNYALLVQPTELGPRSFPAQGLAALAPDLRSMVLAILQASPVRDYLTVSAYSPASDEVVPIALMRLEKLAGRAA